MSFKLKTFFKIMIAWLVHGLQNVMISQLCLHILSYLLANQSMYIILVILYFIFHFRCNFPAKYFWTWEEEFCISKWPCSIYYINTYEISNHFTITLIFFNCKREIYDVAIATVIFTHVKITCYLHVWRYPVLMWKLTWYFIGGYITNK